MFCKQCGTELPDDTKFCPNCGTAVDDAAVPTEETAIIPAEETAIAPAAQTTVAKAETAAVAQTAAASPVPVLVWGIIGLSFSIIFYFSILGIIFSAVARKKANKYMADNGDASNMARVGKGLSKAGIIVGIVNTVLFVLYIALMIFIGYASVNM